MAHELPDRPWAKIGTNLFSLDGIDYRITVDYFSNYWEINRLEDTPSKTIIPKLKGHFARYGYPEVVISDNGPQHSSTDLQNLLKTGILISPGHSQSNRKAESAKRMLRKV